MLGRVNAAVTDACAFHEWASALTLVPYMDKGWRELVTRAGEVLSWLKSGTLKVRIEHEFSLAEAAEAHRALEARKTTGKLLLIP